MATKLENLTDDELAAEGQKLDEQYAEIRERKRGLQRERDRRALQAKVDALSDQDKAALGLSQTVEVKGIESQEGLSAKVKQNPDSDKK
jgi:ABC-type phosphate transport system auxiliary subunit